MTEEEYLVDQITKRVREILKEAIYNNSLFRHVRIRIDWYAGDEPSIDYRYTKGERNELHRTPEEYEEE